MDPSNHPLIGTVIDSRDEDHPPCPIFCHQLTTFLQDSYRMILQTGTSCDKILCVSNEVDVLHRKVGVPHFSAYVTGYICGERKE